MSRSTALQRPTQLSPSTGEHHCCEDSLPVTWDVTHGHRRPLTAGIQMDFSLLPCQPHLLVSSFQAHMALLFQWLVYSIFLKQQSKAQTNVETTSRMSKSVYLALYSRPAPKGHLESCRATTRPCVFIHITDKGIMFFTCLSLPSDRISQRQELQFSHLRLSACSVSHGIN